MISIVLINSKTYEHRLVLIPGDLSETVHEPVYVGELKAGRSELVAPEEVGRLLTQEEFAAISARFDAAFPEEAPKGSN